MIDGINKEGLLLNTCFGDCFFSFYWRKPLFLV